VQMVSGPMFNPKPPECETGVLTNILRCLICDKRRLGIKVSFSSNAMNRHH